MKKILLASSVVLLSLGLTACGSKSANSNSSAKTEQSSKKAANKTISANKELRNKFDKIKIGDLMQQGKGGDTEKSIEKLLGKPNSTNSEKTDGIKTSGATWVDKNITITVAYVNHNAISKQITGFKWSGREKKLTLKAYNAIKNGVSYESVIKKYGEPDGLDESLIMGKKTITATWLTGVKGDNPTVTLTFTNNKLTGKSQTALDN